jgi:predicted metalloprotease with PDZ domain
MKPMFRWISVLLLTLLASPAARATTGANGQIQIDYRVKVASVENQLFKVTMNISGIKQPELKLMLPVWIPGLYKAESYAKNILRLKIADAKGERAPSHMVAMQAWLVDTSGLDRLTVEYEYRAETLAINQPKITKDFAIFMGAETLLFVDGAQKTPCKLRVEAPEGWEVMTPLRESSEPGSYEAANYDELAFSPVEIGKFDVTKFWALGKPHFLVTSPAGAYPKESSQKLAGIFERLVTAEGGVFGELPYDKYVYFYIVAKPDWTTETSMGFGNSQISFLRPGEATSSRRLPIIAAHEQFHAWNLNRIRPAELYPYDYSNMGVSPLLWFSEGVTNYFGRLARYRSGIESRDGMLGGLREMIFETDTNEAKSLISLADSSCLVWLEYATSKPFNTPTRAHGEIIALMLDLAIRRDSHGAASLEDFIRALYKETYQKDRGFTVDDLTGIARRLTGRDYKDFFKKYVWGVERPPYNEMLAAIGYQYEHYITKVPLLGFRIAPTPEGPAIGDVLPGSVAAEAGLAKNDLLLEIDGLDVRHTVAALSDWLTPKIGQVVKAKVKRGDEVKTLDLKVGSRDSDGFKLSELPTATPGQLQAREAWLKRDATTQAQRGGLE